MNILIITGGSIDYDFAPAFLNTIAYDQVIAVDSGLTFADYMSRVGSGRFRINHLVGDFDSVPPEILKKYITNPDIKVHEFNPEKDYTDTDIALKLALCLAAGDDQIYILGATGSRIDHLLANIQLLLLAHAGGIPAYIIDSANRIQLISGSKRLLRKEQFGNYVSLIPVSDTLAGIDLTGFKYPLDNRTVQKGESLCVSNEIEDEIAYINIRQGLALLIESKDK